MVHECQAQHSALKAGVREHCYQAKHLLEKLGDADIDISRVHFLMHPSTAADLMKSRVDANNGALVLSDLKTRAAGSHLHQRHRGQGDRAGSELRPHRVFRCSADCC